MCLFDILPSVWIGVLSFSAKFSLLFSFCACVSAPNAFAAQVKNVFPALNLTHFVKVTCNCQCRLKTAELNAKVAFYSTILLKFVAKNIDWATQNISYITTRLQAIFKQHLNNVFIY